MKKKACSIVILHTYTVFFYHSQFNSTYSASSYFHLQPFLKGGAVISSYDVDHHPNFRLDSGRKLKEEEEEEEE